MDRPVTFKQGDDTMVAMELTPMLKEGHKLKVGIYSPYGKPLYETCYPDDDDIVKVDDNHFLLKLDYELTRKFKGANTLRAVIYTADRTFVNSGEKAINLFWDEEPATKNLK